MQCLDVLTWEREPDQTRDFWSLCWSRSRAPYVCCVCLQWEKDVDYLPMAKPVSQLTTRRSASTVCTIAVMPVDGSLHRRPWSLSHRGQGEVCLKFVRSGYKVIRLLISWPACTLCCGTRTFDCDLVLTSEKCLRRPFPTDELRPGKVLAHEYLGLKDAFLVSVGK
jgi:hypothetical protein